MELTGIIEEITNIQIISTKNGDLKKRELILKIEKKLDNYDPIIDYISIEFLQDNAENLNNYKKGDEVKVNCNIRGRKWVNPEGIAKYFNSIQGWRIEKINPSSSFQKEEENNFNQDNKNGNMSSNSFDDLPF